MHIPSQIEYMLRKLSSCGYEAYLVGGCVRDYLLGKTPNDYDITTSALPDETMDVFAGDRVIPTGIKHGTVTVLYDGVAAEITTYRTETTYTDGRHPDKVEFSLSISDDLCRRDFTVNAMAMDIDSNIVDLYGGRADLEKKVIRTVGNPKERFTEDALRILRAFRFASKLGFEIEENTLSAAVSLADRLSLVSRERIFDELMKLICGMHAGKIVRLMYENKIFDCIFDIPVINEAALAYFDRMPSFENARFAALLLYDERICEHVKSLKTSSEFAMSVKKIVECHLPDAYDKPTLRRIISKYGHAALDRCIAEGNSSGLGNMIFELIDTENCFSVSDLDISGNDIMAMGKQGKDIGKTLNELLFAVFDEKVANNRKDLIEYIKKVDNT
ncbi:MAG: CCA tRNA nucleotidyltransferase [Clostridia bacterium]|nr:CCA tRNA nucleotidyltransferase [Clostridia bacterium]